MALRALIEADSLARRAVDSLATQYAEQMREIAQRALLGVQTLLGPHPTAQAWRRLGGYEVEQLAALFRDAGLSDVFERMVPDYARVLRAARGTLAPLSPYLPPDAFEALSIRAIKASVAADGGEMARIGGTWARRVRSAIQDWIAGPPLSWQQAVAQLQPVTDMAAAQLTTVAHTGLATVQRRLHAEVAGAVGSKARVWRVYLGAGRDQVIRQFCGVLTGKAIPPDLLDRLDPRSGLPVLTGAGGWNCRHTLIPVPESYVEDNHIPRVTVADVAKANHDPQGLYFGG